VNLEPGQVIKGEIDWARRFDHMQQHSGQHVLSAAFDKLFGVRTVSFHLGGLVSRSIWRARCRPPRSRTQKTRPIASSGTIVRWTIRFADAEEAARLTAAQGAKRGGTAAVVDMDGFDLSACGGQHVARHRRHRRDCGRLVGAVQGRTAPLVSLRWPRSQRVPRAPRLGRRRRSAAIVLPAELPQTIERLQGEAKAQQRLLGGLQTELARYRAEELAGTADEVTVGSTARLVARALDADAQGLKALASAIVARPGYIVVLLSSSPPPVVAVVARSADVDLSAQKVLAASTQRSAGEVGGSRTSRRVAA
jgi:alanyl-tRNA synthetase